MSSNVFPGKVVLIVGLLITALGLYLLWGKGPMPGKLPGDIMVKKNWITFYFPLSTSILISVLLSLFMYILRRCQ